eukprot:331403-Pelagomonas_calceolata.AAC.2
MSKGDPQAAPQGHSSSWLSAFLVRWLGHPSCSTDMQSASLSFRNCDPPQQRKHRLLKLHYTAKTQVPLLRNHRLLELRYKEADIQFQSSSPNLKPVPQLQLKTAAPAPSTHEGLWMTRMQAMAGRPA